MTNPDSTKPVAIPWHGQVPEHWEVKRLKYLLARNDGGVWGEEDDPEGTIVLRSTDQTVDGEWNVVDPARRALSTREAADGRLEIGDLVVTKSSGSQLHIGKTCIVTAELAYSSPCFSNFMQRLRTKDELVPRLAWYVLNSELGRQQLVFNSNTTTGLANLNGTVLGEILLPLPPLPEQRAIATYLDERTARIDGLVARQRRLVQLLKEKRQALITRAVTRGLDPKTKVKDSGVPWLGEVPVGWEVKRLKHISEFITSGSRGWAEHYADKGALFIRIGNLDRTSIDLRLDDIQRVDPPSSAEVIRTRALSGDLLISITAFLGTIGLVPNGLGDAYINQHTALIRLQHTICHPRFVAYWFTSSAAQQQFESASQGGTKEGMSLQEVRDLITLQPNYEEQKRIADALDESLGKVDALITKVEQSVERLQEYRTALISAAVTGKVRVPQ